MAGFLGAEPLSVAPNEKVRSMKLSDFMYDLPEERIAQTPVEPRDHSRLMVLHRRDNSIEHKHFYDIIDYLNPGDALVINETRVIPARLIGERPSGGACEILLLKPVSYTHLRAHET